MGTAHWNGKFQRRRTFVTPFKRGGCAPTALAVLADGDADDAQRIANKAGSMFDKKHGSSAGLYVISNETDKLPNSVKRWLEVAGLRAVEVLYFLKDASFKQETFTTSWGWTKERTRCKGLPTVGKLAREQGKLGRWLVATDGHVFALINGVGYNHCGARMRVEWAVRVEKV